METFKNKFKIPKILTNNIRNLNYSNYEIESIGTFKVGEDLIIADGYVKHHVDNTEIGKNSIMLILLNDGNYEFNYHGDVIQLPVGKLFRFNGNLDHALLTTVNINYKKYTNGRFAAIIWDVPTHWPTYSFEDDLNLRIEELTDDINS